MATVGGEATAAAVINSSCHRANICFIVVEPTLSRTSLVSSLETPLQQVWNSISLRAIKSVEIVGFQNKRGITGVLKKKQM